MNMCICMRYQVRNLLEALSGQHRGNMFDNVINDINVSSTVLKNYGGRETAARYLDGDANTVKQVE